MWKTCENLTRPDVENLRFNYKIFTSIMTENQIRIFNILAVSVDGFDVKRLEGLCLIGWRCNCWRKDLDSKDLSN